MSVATAQPKHIYGLSAHVNNHLAYHDEQTLVYPAGSNCVLYHSDQASQKFLSGSEKSQGITAMAVSPNHRYVALAEKGEKPTITVYDMHSLRKRKVLSSDKFQSEEFVSIAFSPDSKYLAAQGGNPDWLLFYWTWEKNKVLASVKSTNPQTNTAVSQVTFSPQDTTVMCVSGDCIFKIYRYSEGNLKQSLQKGDSQLNFTAHSWLPDEKILVGTELGKVFLYEAGECRAQFQPLERTEESEEVELLGKVTAITTYSKGFVCACGPGKAFLFEKSEEKEMFKKIQNIEIPQDLNSADPTKAQKQQITGLAVSPSEETLVASTDNNQLYSILLSSIYIAKDEAAKFEIMTSNFHNDKVTGLAVCIRKPLLVACSPDHTVNIWNYEKATLELHREFAEQAHSVSLHPSGLYIAVGFNDKLRLLNILIDDIRIFKEFPIRACRECCFSHGGHILAAANGNIIQLFSTSTFEMLTNMKGHNGQISSIHWSSDDIKLVSCGSDGAVYEWDAVTGRRISETVLKGCRYNGVAFTAVGKSVLAVGSDKKMKELSESQTLQSVDIGDRELTSICMSHCHRMLFVGTATGTVCAVQYPLTTPCEFTEYQAHASTVNNLLMSYDDQFLFSCSNDGSVMIWSVQDKQGRGLKQDKDIIFAEEILITKSDLEEKNVLTVELKQRVEELRTENDYQLRLRDMNYNERIRELTEKFIQEMESLKTRHQVLKANKDKDDMIHEEMLKEQDDKFSNQLQEIEAENNMKLMTEYEKFQELQGRSQEMQEDYENKLAELEDDRQKEVLRVTEEYEEKIKKIELAIKQMDEEKRNMEKMYETIKEEMEEDADREIIEMKTHHETELKREREINADLSSTKGILDKKNENLLREVGENKEEIRKIQSEAARLRNVITSLEKDILGLKKEIQERDETIQDKEKRIFDLKKKNQELEKFKFVLDYKIKELKKQIEPKDDEIKDKKEQITSMEEELERSKKEIEAHSINLKDQRSQLEATKKELGKEMQKVFDLQLLVRRFKTDLHNCVGYIQEPKKLKDSIRELYDKHRHDDIGETASVDADIQKEHLRQREHLEKSVTSLRNKLSKDSEIHRADNVRIMQENVDLIKEINDLRKQLKISRSEVHDLEAALGLHRKNNKTSLAETLATLNSDSKTAHLKQDLQEKNKVIGMQQELIQRLRQDLDRQSPNGMHRLPPMAI